MIGNQTMAREAKPFSNENLQYSPNVSVAVSTGWLLGSLDFLRLLLTTLLLILRLSRLCTLTDCAFSPMAVSSDTLCVVSLMSVIAIVWLSEVVPEASSVYGRAFAVGTHHQYHPSRH